ncbi:histidine kinase [Sulfurifustis variabilis]|uniref:histidine kinase n=1 Tax=Sulfurifustis variabilis TaxID=1675686 RepID=A0A1C7AFN7_9GAMM|nr:PAS domain S-box protein [Sulfurifustis variabilis]BAU50180.1 histidine kinase [Sulfurifustis variabilis]
MTRDHGDPRALLESATEATFLLAEGIEDCNDRTVAVLGLSRERLIGRTLPELSPSRQPDGGASAERWARRAQAAASGLEQCFEWRFVGGNGEPLDTLLSLEPVESDGRALLLARVRDLTHLRRAESALAESETRLQQILDNTTALIYVKDREGRFLFANRHFLRVFRRGEQDVVGRTDADIFPSAQAAEYADNDRLVLERNAAIEFEESAMLDGAERAYLSIKFPLFNTQGEAYAVCGISTDITERKRTAEALRHAALGVSGARGRDVFPALARYLATALGVDFAFIALPIPGKPGRMRTLALYVRGEIAESTEYDLAGSPCSRVVGQQFRFFARDTCRMFPGDSMLSRYAIEGYAAIPLFDSRGRPMGLMGALHDRPLADERLAESMLKIFSVRAAAELERMYSEASYRSIFEASEDAIFVHDWDTGAIVDVNPKACAAYGYSYDEMRRINVGDLSSGEPPYTLEEAGRLFEKVKRGEPQRIEWHRRNKDGSLHWDEVYIRAAEIAGENRIVAFTREITERKHAEEALRASEEQYRAIFNSSVDGLGLCAFDGRVVDANPAFCRLHGYTREELLATESFQFLHPDSHIRCWAFFEAVSQGRPISTEAKAQRKDGTTFDAEVHGVHVQYQGQPHLLIITRDITERKEREEALRRSENRLRQSEERYRLLFEMESDAIVLVDAETFEHLDVNRAAVDLYGYTREELLRLKSTDLSAESEKTQAAMRSGTGFVRVPLRYHRKKDGTLFPVEITANFFELHGRKIMLAAIRDITERKRAEEARAQLEAQLRQAQKMEAIGHLSGGIAHDFNNILTTVMGYIAMAQERLARAPDDKLERYLERALRSGRQARDLIQQLLTFSRGQRGAPRPLALAPLVNESVKLLRSTLPSSIEFETAFDSALPAVQLDPVQLDQVLMNLCINARDAMDGSGVLHVGLRRVRHGAVVCSSCRQQVRGDFVELAVGDTGAGIAPEVLDRMFEPFFTTKEPGKGSGMGLSTVHGIVHEHGGHVVVETAPGAGARFRVLFRAMPEAAQSAATPGAADTSAASTRRLRGRALVVDDEPAVAEFMQELLESWGVEVTVRNNPVEAQALFAEHPDRFDLVVTDQTMPKLTGLELARALSALRPGLPVLLYTGYAERLTEEQTRAAGVRALVRKPIDTRQFFVLLEEYLRA